MKPTVRLNPEKQTFSWRGRPVAPAFPGRIAFRTLFRHRVLVLGFCCGLLGVPSLAVADDSEAIDLRKQMPPEVFRASGLSRLSTLELQVLNIWLTERNRKEPDSAVPQQPSVNQQAPIEPVIPAVTGSQSTRSEPPAVSTAQASDLGAEQLPQARAPRTDAEAIEAKIVGSFSGWTGKTVFKLDNGQVWQQRVRGRYSFRADSPVVTIERGRFGYYLTLVETGRKVGIKRIK